MRKYWIEIHAEIQKKKIIKFPVNPEIMLLGMIPKVLETT